MCQFTRLSDVSGESMKTTALISCFVFCAQFGSSLAARPLSERLAADIEMAEHSILASLVVHKSSESKSLCSQTPYACVGADGAELGLALIGGSRSAAAPRHLVELSRFRMDGALSEDYKCYLAAHGNSVAQAAPKLDAKKLAGQCMSEFAALKRRAGAAKFDVAPENICNSVGDIQRSLREAVRLANAGGECDGF
ncbi:Imm57 family immunity protein [Stenotrophomonas pavanii]|uniref:Imm57 family immunity protein n=1 Tax=Stenotrophomonas pavanii TaxID=487698 RepID=UPI00197F0223|nr:Imm57 family immunity protein [Stenotrophomonas pavanii]